MLVYDMSCNLSFLKSTLLMHRIYTVAAAGYSTDRGEKYHIDVSRSNTLDLKDRKMLKVGSSSDLDGISSPVPMAGFEDDRNLTAVGDHGYDNDNVSVFQCYFVLSGNLPLHFTDT